MRGSQGSSSKCSDIPNSAYRSRFTKRSMVRVVAAIPRLYQHPSVRSPLSVARCQLSVVLVETLRTVGGEERAGILRRADRMRTRVVGRSAFY
jgi:hypothetical protein